MKKITILLFAIFIFTSINSFAQDVSFSQNFSNPLSLNPAFAGSLGCSRFVADYKNQFISSQENDATYCASYDQYVKFLSGGIGLTYTFNNNGDGLIKENLINGSYALNIRINDNFHIRPAINIGYEQNYLDWSKLPFDDANVYGMPPTIYIPSQLEPGNLTKGYFNAGAGLLLTYKNLISGIAIDHINQPNIGFITIDKLPVKLTIHSSFQNNITDNSNFTLGVIYQEQANSMTNLITSFMFKIWHIKSGVALRWTGNDDKDGIIGMLGFVNNWISIGYSYEFFVYGTSITPNTNEISAVFKFNCKNKDKFGITKLYAF